MARKKRTQAQSRNKTTMDKAFGFGYSEVALQILNSMDQPARNPDVRMFRYREMLDDETIATGMEFLTYTVVSKIGSYSHPDQRIKDLVDESREKIRGTLEESRRAVLENGLAFGFGVSEFSLTAEDGAWFLSSMQAYDPATLEFLFERQEDNSVGIKTVRQKIGGKELDIPAAKCLIFRHGSGTTPYGKSRLRRCWRWHAFKRAIPKFWAVALERFGMPALVGKSEDPEQMSKILENAYSKAHFAISPGDSIEALVGNSGNNAMGNGYEQAIEFCNRMLYRGMFLPSLLEGGEGGGSYSLGQIHWRMFVDACLWLARELAEAELEQVWRPIIDWNFGPQEDYGKLDVSDAGTPEEREILSKIFLNGVNAGYLFPDEGDAGWMRELLGLPSEPEGGEPVAWRSRLSQNSSPDGGEEKETKPSK